jgi:hypothetical protein
MSFSRVSGLYADNSGLTDMTRHKEATKAKPIAVGIKIN